MSETLDLLRFRQLDGRNARASDSHECVQWLAQVADEIERYHRALFMISECPNPSSFISTALCVNLAARALSNEETRPVQMNIALQGEVQRLIGFLERIIAKEKAGHSRKELAAIAREALGITGEQVREISAR